VCVQEANLGKVAKSCSAHLKGSIFKKLIKTILPTFVKNMLIDHYRCLFPEFRAITTIDTCIPIFRCG